jgi:hypothetical protein
MSVNKILDTLPRTRFGRATREAPAFRVCGVAGFYVAVVLTLGGGLLASLSLLVLCVLCAVCGLSFFVYAYLRRWIGGEEKLVLLEQARALPGAVADTALLSDVAVLHVLAADLSAPDIGPDHLASALLGEVARRRQREIEAPTDELTSRRESAPDAYFGG